MTNEHVGQLSKRELLEKCYDDLSEVKLLLRAIASKLNIDPEIVSDVSSFDSALNTSVLTPDENFLSTQVSNLLKELGAPCHILGYKYSCDAIIYILNKEVKDISMTKELYPYVANLHGTTSSRVERAIRHLIEKSWSRGNIEYIDSLFGYRISKEKGKPTNSEFLYAIADYLELAMKIY